MIKKLIVNIIINGLALYLTSLLLSSVAIEGGLATYIYAGVILGFLNLTVKRALKLITTPLKYLTVGLSLIAINIFIFYLADLTLETLFGLTNDIIIQKSLVSYIKAGILFGAINWLENIILK